jgi:hypothetical protein
LEFSVRFLGRGGLRCDDAGGNVQFLAQSLSWLWKILDYRFLNTVVFIVGIGLFLYALMRKEKSDSSLVGSSPNEETGIGKLPTNSVGTDQSGLIIHSALWGAVGRYCDLRSKLQAKVQDDTLDAVVRFPDDQTMPKHAHL